MKLKAEIRYKLTITLLLAIFLMFTQVGYASEREIEFKVLERGAVSGYCEEAYIVVKNEADWVNIWKRHTLIREPLEPSPNVNFSRSLVVCAFMGKRPTTGYFIDVEKVWTDGEYVFVKVVKHSPSEDLVTCQMITCPYIMILMEKIDMPFIFWVVDEDVESRPTLTECSSSVSLGMFMLILATVLIIKRSRY